MNPLRALRDQGQSVWLDYIDHRLVRMGGLARLIEDDGVRGVTSNPAIFEKAITSSADYDGVLRTLAPRCPDAKTLYEQVAIRDVQDAADILRSVYDESDGRDGYVSLEVSPELARDTDGTLEEARRLWRAVDRKNLMIKVPATQEGIPAIARLIGEGINVNVTLLFHTDMYERAARAYVAGVEALAERGSGIAEIASVASFFISRIDTAVDALLAKKIEAAGGPEDRKSFESLLGKAAIASAKQAYRRYQQIFAGPVWERLSAKGARTQRVLWASTSTKNPAYRDVLYVEELIGPDTVNTIPPATLEAFRDHGRVQPTLLEGHDEAEQTIAALEAVGIPLTPVADELLDQGVQLFADAFRGLLGAVERARQQAVSG